MNTDTLTTTIAAEFSKQFKRKSNRIVMIFAPIVFSYVMLIYCLIGDTKADVHGVYTYYAYCWGLLSAFVLPLVCAVFSSNITTSEIEKDTTVQENVRSVFFSNVVVSLFYTAIVLIVSMVCQFMLANFILHHPINIAYIVQTLTIPLGLLLFALPIIVIHTWLGMRLNWNILNILTAFLVSCVSAYFVLMLEFWSASNFLPLLFYSLPMQFVFSYFPASLSEPLFSNLLNTWQYVGYAALLSVALLALGYRSLTKYMPKIN